MCVFFQTQLTELTAAYKKVHKVELADEIEKKCSGDLKTTLLAKLGKKGNLFFCLGLFCVNLLNLLGSFFSRSSERKAKEATEGMEIVGYVTKTTKQPRLTLKRKLVRTCF